METLNTYVKKIYEARYFLLHLVNWDIKYKFRRSKLGIIWTVLQPFLLTLIIALVFGYVFDQEMTTYAPYILSGVLVWDIISAAIIGNGSSFLAAETYIRQFAHPITLYPLRAAMVSVITFIIATIGLFTWIGFVYPENIPIALISLPLTAMIYFLMAWALSIISSHINVRYRDYPYVMQLVMQFLWYMSPVFFKEEMFESNALLHSFFLVNPITHVLMLIREPFLSGSFAPIVSYVYTFAIASLLLIIAWHVNKKLEKTVIYYL